MNVVSYEDMECFDNYLPGWEKGRPNDSGFRRFDPVIPFETIRYDFHLLLRPRQSGTPPGDQHPTYLAVRKPKVDNPSLGPDTPGTPPGDQCPTYLVI
ncbi:hypothetical protein MTP99_019819 [Tenebrio molitor]|jgi:hypothetical protein|nr:hypothetical protein MTP99_019819 [Tenebrio molitor]